MEPLSLCINTQTPLLQFPSGATPGASPRSKATDLRGLVDGVDYRLSPGGVTRMVYPLVRRLANDGVLRDVHWVSLNPQAPPTIHLPDLTIHNVRVEAPRMASYASVKEAIWGRVHGTDGGAGDPELFWEERFGEYAYYNRRTAELIRRLDAAHDFDAFYIHDFQQLPVGRMLGSMKPKIFRWHIPFDGSEIPEEWVAALLTYLAGYDAVVVSTKGYAKNLRTFGYEGKIFTGYPYVDPEEFERPSLEVADARLRRFGISPEHRILLVVGRMDPTKGQDSAIRAFARLSPEFPELRLVLAGNGSFSGAKGGLGLSKAELWRAKLESLIGELHLEGKVLLTGHVDQKELDALYERSSVSLLPSVQEGFGLVVVESWLHARPTLVSQRAGIAELVRDGVNALLFDPSDDAELAEKIAPLLRPRGAARGQRIARAGRLTARRCSIDAAARSEGALLRQVVGR